MNSQAATEKKRAPRIGRRAVLQGGALAVLIGGGVVLLARRRPGPADSVETAPGQVFTGDAPRGDLWQRWQKRGWAKKALYWESLGTAVKCRLCPNECVLKPGDRSHCRNKVNHQGKLYTLAYGNPCSAHVDPIEKKPLLHFLPGARAFSIATSGCNLRCLNCQNWEISQKEPEALKDASGPDLVATREVMMRLGEGDMARLSMFPDQVVELAAATGCQTIAYTYSEPISFYEYMLETARAARARGIKNVWITNGYIQAKPLLELCGVLDAANVNLKSYSNDIYAKLNQGKLEPILATLRTLKAQGVWFEVTHLVVPTYTDDLGMIRRMCGWMARELGPEQPLHLSRFHPEYKLDRLPPTPIEVLLKAREVARAEGLKHVYVGNARGVPEAETTRCAGCGRVLVERSIYSVQALRLDRNKCPYCGKVLAGVWVA
ncbi:MAG: AmmeMemoRadiSam system radical SAM enzyme [Polyangiaceae bacterium]|nr:AmmeMemoRadiSam system radical SAM enzyme [Polyangiaceae bacterium]